MATLVEQCLNEPLLVKKLSILSRFLTKFGLITVTLNCEVLIVAGKDVEPDAFFAYRDIITKDINKLIHSSIKNN